MKTVNDLSRDELDELKENYFWQLQDNDEEVLSSINSPSEIPDSVILEHYDGISFVEDDFFCNQI